MRVVIIGSGNVATVFALRLFANNINIVQIVARNLISGKILAEKVKASCVSSILDIEKDADAYILAVQDDMLPTIAKSLEGILPKNTVIVHTTGSASIKVLEKTSNQYGVLYPLQSLRKENISETDIPLCLDANNPEALEKIKFLAERISNKIGFANDEQRIKLHIAAVFVSNFPNYLYTLADGFCEKNNIEFSFLLPLMKETINRLDHFSPKEIQTGPAARGDMSTIDKHKTILANENPNLLPIYEVLTNGILKEFSKKQK